MKKDKKFNNTIFNKALYTFIVVIAFSFAFVLLVKNQYNDSLGDVSSSLFDVKTIDGKQLVVQDLSEIYPKYYVIYFDKDMYIIHAFNYYNTKSQYELEFKRLSSEIIDYNIKDNMIRTYVGNGYGLFNYVKNNIISVIGKNNIKVLG